MATNNGRKISNSNATTLARLISNKAFEHLINPLEAELSDIASKAVAADFIGKNLEDLVRANLVRKSDDRTRIELMPYSFEVKGGVQVSGQFGFKEVGYPDVQICNDHYYNMALPLKEQLQGFQHKRFNLRETIKSQVEGRTVSAVLKAWPEASPFLDEIFGGTTEMTQPLEALLARFLPMLPAPKEG